MYGIAAISQAKVTLEFFQKALMSDIAEALEVGYSKDEIVLFVIDADGPQRAEIIDRLCPDADWQSIRDRGLRPVVRGVAPPWLSDLFQSIIPHLERMRRSVSETGLYPVVIIHDNIPVPLVIEAKDIAPASGDE